MRICTCGESKRRSKFLQQFQKANSTDNMEGTAAFQLPEAGQKSTYMHVMANTERRDMSPPYVRKQKHINSSRTLQANKKIIPLKANKSSVATEKGMVSINSFGTFNIDNSHINDRTIHIMQAL